MNRQLKDFLNSLRCPLCQGQIDGFDWAPVGAYASNFGCATANNHYKLQITNVQESFQLNRETVEVCGVEFKYIINQTYFLKNKPVQFTNISVRDIDPEQRLIDKLKRKEISFDKIMFDFGKTNKEKLLSRIKTVIVFR
jgi:hypothetical protein